MSTLLGPMPAATSPIGQAMQVVGATLRWVAFFSFFVNLLALTSSVYMLQVYDRVLSSRSGATLLGLTLFAALCLLTLAGLEVVRSRLLARMGVRFDARLARRVFDQTLTRGRSAQSLRDLEQVRAFVTGPTMLHLVDAPWMPVYIGLVYVLHPWLGHVALVGGVVLFALGWWNERATRAPLAEAGRELTAGARFAELAARNAETIRAMGMLPGLARIWRLKHELGLGLQALASDRGANVSALAKAMRLFLQIAILGVGAWLVIDGHSTAGVMIAASIIMGRALAPLESAIGGWNSLVAAREAYRRLAQELDREEPAVEPMRLPAPTGALVFESVAGGPPGARAAAVQGVHLVIEPGVCVGVTGPSGAGKSTLMRLAAGVWPAMQGCVRLDGADIAAWDRTDLGPHVGYLPQDIELFPGTVAENIARFGKVNAAAVVEAARLAGAHQMILGLQSGYDTELGPGGANVSGGQRQRIGLARAFYGSPALIVLDEPTSNLDAEGENTVRQAIDALRQRRSTVLVVAHRPALLGGTDRLLVMTAGQVARFGPTSELMPQITRRVVAGPDAASSPAAPSAPMRHA